MLESSLDQEWDLGQIKSNQVQTPIIYRPSLKVTMGLRVFKSRGRGPLVVLFQHQVNTPNF